VCCVLVLGCLLVGGGGAGGGRGGGGGGGWGVEGNGVSVLWSEL
jgi:hypothetical protein